MTNRHVRSVPPWTALVVCLVAAASGGPSAQSSGQRPVFRGGAAYVEVDAYPTKDGRIVEGLRPADFEILEDGKPQQVESVEFIRIEPNTPEAERRDPNTQEEGNTLAADPRNRVFVVYLDHYHTNLDGSYYVRRPLVDMLNRMLAPNDLFGVSTPLLRPTDLVLGRKTTTIEEQLSKYWTWGDAGQSGDFVDGNLHLEPSEVGIERCYGRDVAVAVARRTREERVLNSLVGLVQYLGHLREARKAVIVMTRGWVLYRPDQGALESFLDPSKAARPGIGVTPTGRLTNVPAVTPNSADWAACNAEIARAFMLDNWQRFRDLVEAANRNNVTFYPVNPAGLEASASLSGVRAITTREDSMRTIAENTDGLAVVTNDLSGGLRRVTDDVSAYYLLGYYSTNTRFDGAYRRIQVRMRQPGVSVKARRGYLAPSEAERTAGEAAPSAAPEGARAVDDALGVLARLRPTAELFLSATVTVADVAVVVELPGDRTTGVWAQGADVQVTMNDSSGTSAGTGRGRIDAGARGALVRIPRAAGRGPWRVSARVAAGGEVLTDSADAVEAEHAVIGEPIVYRATPSGQSPLRPVGDRQFRRTERVHLEWPVLAALDQRDAKLLGRDGKPLAVPVRLSERDEGGRPVLVADLNLAPLAAGDYLIDLTVTGGSKTERSVTAIRVRQ